MIKPNALRGPGSADSRWMSRRQAAVIGLLPFQAWTVTGCMTRLILWPAPDFHGHGLTREYRASYEECRRAIEEAVAATTPEDGSRIRAQQHRRRDGSMFAERSLGGLRALHDIFLLTRRPDGGTVIEVYSTQMDADGRLPIADNERASRWHTELTKRLWEKQ